MRKTQIITFLFLIACNLLFGQCTVVVDVANIQHVTCPNGGAVGSASIQQSNFTNYWWHNITTGQQNSNFGNGVTTVNNLDAGLYVITATDPFNNSCPSLVYSDTFEIVEAQTDFQFNPNQACPFLCNVLVTTSMQIGIAGVSYDYQFDANPIVSLPNTLTNQCGGLHTYEIFADGIGCGVENIGISQFAQMNLITSVTNPICTQQGSATVNITGVGASAISTYCNSAPQLNYYTTIDNIYMLGDNTIISNNTSNICDMYQDYTAQSADVTQGNTYDLTIDLGTCNTSGEYLIDMANIYIDWNIDGDFDDANELAGQVSPTQSPSTHTISITVPTGATPGQSRMRIIAQNNEYQPGNQAFPCDYNSAYFGSTEDYTILIGGSVATPVSYLWSDGQTTATANNLGPGNYTVTITDANGCSAIDTAIVAGPTQLTVTASGSQIICNGGTPNSLTASSAVTGTYSWSPSSDFVDANIQTPIFNSGLTSTTTYTVAFTDSLGCTATDSVLIIVNPVPTVILTANPNFACIGDDIMLTAIPSVSSVYRFQYRPLGSNTWTPLTSPVWSSVNPQTYFNIGVTTDFRVKVREASGCIASPWSSVITVPVNMISTPLISHN